MRLEEWFEDRVLFHLVGYLVHERVSLGELRQLSQSLTKSSFDQALRRKIFEVAISANAPAQLTTETARSLVQARLEQLEYGGSAASRRDILSMLLLFNVATLVENPASNIRFQFDSFKKQEWNIEHVRSIASEPPLAHAERQAWLRLCLDHLDPTQAETPALRADIEAYLGRPKPIYDLEFPPLYERVLKQFGEASDSGAIHGIANLALLDAATNKSYKNAPFAVKRKRLLALDQAGTFVPLCTRNVFLKCYSAKVDTVMFWSEDDQSAYQDAIVRTLVAFFTSTTKGET